MGNIKVTKRCMHAFDVGHVKRVDTCPQCKNNTLELVVCEKCNSVGMLLCDTYNCNYYEDVHEV